MFTIIYDSTPGPYAATRPQLSPGYQVRTIAFWLGAQADDGQKGPVSIRTGKPKEPKTLDPMAAPFKIVVGGVYRCRDGWLVHIHRRRIGPMGQVSFFGSRINPSTSQASREEEWEPDGKFSRALYGDFHDYTIVSPYSQPKEP